MSKKTFYKSRSLPTTESTLLTAAAANDRCVQYTIVNIYFTGAMEYAPGSSRSHTTILRLYCNRRLVSQLHTESKSYVTYITLNLTKN